MQKVHGCVDFNYCGIGQRFSKLEKDSWSNNANVRFQKKACVDRPVMIDIEKDFIKSKVEKHGTEAPVLLYCDNLDAYWWVEVLTIFRSGNTLL